jgi:hypothetical protein
MSQPPGGFLRGRPLLERLQLDLYAQDRQAARRDRDRELQAAERRGVEAARLERDAAAAVAARRHGQRQAQAGVHRVPR